ncbi:BTAD domain-containing putative transcriptional regulator [Nocardiopsis sediminis]|uniref:BTAD domain-containing putative transcriptional regulator n=1 Tax=Nocardiopsis sediminis TaxID=1778267 RepID=A0ABV8FNM3_9ACTN
MRFSILGPLSVRGADGRPLTVGGTRLRRLLVLLLRSPGRTIGAGLLIDGVWGDDAPAAAGNALQALASRLRRTLGDPALLHGDATGYRLDVAPEQIDLFVFEDLVHRGRQARADGDPQTAARLLGDALALWRGPALADLGDAGADLAARLAESRRGAAADRLAALLDLGAHTDVLPEIEELAARDPHDERTVELLMRALAAAGRQADALAAYDRLRAGLAGELGIDPSTRLRDLHLRLLRGELDPAPEEPAPPPAPDRPAARHTPTTRLPHTLTSFIAREGEIADTVALLSTERLVTLIGPGGAGKTRLSIETGARFAERRPDLAHDGVWFVELAPVSDGADIPHAVQTALGLGERSMMALHATTPAPPADVMDRIVEGLGHRELLVVLDNCEHLIADAAAVAGRLLAACPGLRILTTSREPLGVAGERLQAVPSLALPPEGTTAETALDYASVRLFAERVAAVVPGFTVDDTNAEHVVRICRELDGMPLALELAAARVRAMPVSRLASGLSDRFRLLTSGTRFALPRHQTLQAVVDWSWDLLDAPQRALLRRMSVFSGGATLEAVEHVCVDGAGGTVGGRDVWSVLFTLVDKSLVLADPAGSGTEPRYRMLETVRAYGAQRLAESGEDPAVRRAHAEHVLALWTEADAHLRRADQITWLGRLRAEHDNFTAALRWAVDSGEGALALDLSHSAMWYWQMVDGWADAARWAAEIVRLVGDEPPEGRAVAFAGCLFTMGAGELSSAGAEKRVLRADEVLRAAGEKAEDHASLLFIPGYLAMLGHRPDAMRDRLRAAEDHSDPWVRATGKMATGLLDLLMGGDVRAGRDRLGAALSEFRALGDRWGTCQTLVISSELMRLDDLAAERDLLAEGARLAGEMRLTGLEVMLASRRAVTRARLGDIEAARAEIAAAISANPEHRGGALLRVSEAEIERAAGAPARSREILLGLAEEIEENAGKAVRSQVLPLWLGLLARASDDLGDPGEARRYAAAAWRALGERPSAMHRSATVELVAGVMGAEHPERAATLLGFAEAVRGLPNRAEPDVVRVRRRLRAAMGATAFDRAYARGARTPREDAAPAVDAWIDAWAPEEPDGEG